MDSKLDLGEFPMNFPTSVSIPILFRQWNNDTCQNWDL
jgi:hypothetical protein